MALDTVEATAVAVAHLAPHVETFALDATDSVRILIAYSCHCWTCAFDPVAHASQTMFIDGTRHRAFDPVRHDASVHLGDLLRALPENRLYVTPSDRNYGVYNATLPDESGAFYTAFFTLTPRSGRFNGTRHQLTLYVESAYARSQPEGMKTSFRAAVAKAREGKTVKYRR